MRFSFFTNRLSNNYPAKGRAHKKPLFLSLQVPLFWRPQKKPLFFVIASDPRFNRGGAWQSIFTTRLLRRYAPRNDIGGSHCEGCPAICGINPWQSISILSLRVRIFCGSDNPAFCRIRV